MTSALGRIYSHIVFLGLQRACRKGGGGNSSNLGVVLELVVGVDPAQEVLSAAGGGHVLDAHVDPLLEYPVAHL
jgi:hypothetical protein